jgi:hypothetical protein
MPAALIEVRRPYTETEETGLINAVHSAMRSAFQLPDNDKTVRLIVHPPHRFAVPPDKTRPEVYTFISIDAFAGRTLETKRILYHEIVKNLEPFGIPGDHILIILRESHAENWGVRGGKAACDVDLGFKVEV